MNTINQNSRKRYIVTYKDPQVNIASASSILGTNDVKEAVSFMATDADIQETDVLHFGTLGSTSSILSDEKAEALRNDNRILAVEEDIEMFALYDSDKSGEGFKTPSLGVAEWNISMVKALQAWTRGLRGEGVKVAIIDTGIAEHADLVVKGGVSFVAGITSYRDDNGHGTHCAGIVGARNQHHGVIGVAPRASLYAVKVLDRNGSGSLSSVLAGIEWALQNGMKVVSMSLGAAAAPLTAYRNALAQLINEGIHVVCASGNQFNTPFPWVGAPANSHPDVIAVGAIDSNQIIGSFSSRGINGNDWNHVSLVAPGVTINSMWPTPPDSYKQLTGTSMACPHVSGAVALLCQKFPNLSPQEIKAKLISTAVPIAGDTDAYGAGLLDCDLLTQ